MHLGAGRAGNTKKEQEHQQGGHISWQQPQLQMLACAACFAEGTLHWLAGWGLSLEGHAEWPQWPHSVYICTVWRLLHRLLLPLLLLLLLLLLQSHAHMDASAAAAATATPLVCHSRCWRHP
jgi:hypothetical protein